MNECENEENERMDLEMNACVSECGLKIGGMNDWPPLLRSEMRGTKWGRRAGRHMGLQLHERTCCCEQHQSQQTGFFFSLPKSKFLVS